MEDETGYDYAEKAERGGQNDRAGEVRKASVGSLDPVADPVERSMVVEHARDHTEDSSSGIVVAVDVVDVVGVVSS